MPANLNPRILRIGILALQDKEEVKIQMEDGGIANTRPGDTRSVFAATGQSGVY